MGVRLERRDSIISKIQSDLLTQLQLQLCFIFDKRFVCIVLDINTVVR